MSVLFETPSGFAIFHCCASIIEGPEAMEVLCSSFLGYSRMCLLALVVFKLAIYLSFSFILVSSRIYWPSSRRIPMRTVLVCLPFSFGSLLLIVISFISFDTKLILEILPPIWLDFFFALWEEHKHTVHYLLKAITNFPHKYFCKACTVGVYANACAPGTTFAKWASWV
jgi:hypothetical protein